MKKLKWIHRQIAGHRHSYFFLLVMAGCAALMPLLAVYLQKFIIDDVFLSGRWEALIPLLLALLIAMAASDLLYSFAAYTQIKFQTRMRAVLTRQFIRRLHQAPIPKLRERQTGQWIHHVNGDVENASGLIALTLPDSIKTMLELLVLLGMIGFLSPGLLGFAVLASPFYLLLGSKFAPQIKGASQDIQAHKSRLTSHLEESISATREVIAFNRRQWEDQAFRRVFGSYFSSVMKEGKLVSLQSLASEPFKWAVSLSVLGFGGYSVMKGTMSPGSFVVVFQLSGRLFDAVQRAYTSVVGFAGASACVERYEGAMEELADPESDNVVPLEGRITSLRLAEVSFQYGPGERKVIDGIMLALPVGKKIAFVGTSGGGKSTIAQLLIGFLQPTEGAIWINGQSLTRIDVRDWRKRAGIVFQEPYLFPDTVRHNLLLGRQASEEQLERVCRLARIDETIRRLPEGYETVLGERGITLSGGQRQRIAIARALLADPEILILDEATSALDMETEQQIIEELDNVRHGKTTVVIAHRLSTVRDADLIYVLDRGRIVEQGGHEELMSKQGVYMQLVEAYRKGTRKTN